MTDKQIIIDGENIERIKTLLLEGQRDVISTKTFEAIIEELESKEQECEELRGDLYFTNEQLKDFKSHYDKVVEECENLREKYLGLKEQKGSYIVQLNTVNEQLDQLKAELEQEKNWHKTSDEISKANSEYTAKLKQTLTEIKEIAEFYNNSNMDNICYQDGIYEILQKISEVEDADKT